MTWILVVFLIGLGLAIGLTVGLVVKSSDIETPDIAAIGILVCLAAVLIFFAGAYHGYLGGWQLFGPS